jgi:hypothetical protein
MPGPVPFLTCRNPPPGLLPSETRHRSPIFFSAAARTAVRLIGAPFEARRPPPSPHGRFRFRTPRLSFAINRSRHRAGPFRCALLGMGRTGRPAARRGYGRGRGAYGRVVDDASGIRSAPNTAIIGLTPSGTISMAGMEPQSAGPGGGLQSPSVPAWRKCLRE